MSVVEVGTRVRLLRDVPVGGELDGGGFLALGAGAEGVVERVDAAAEREPGAEVLEYERLSSLLADFGAQMPPASRARAEAEVAALEPVWRAHREDLRVGVRVRFAGGFVLDGVDLGAFGPAEPAG
ncbi:hypothetical protein ACN20G_24710 [Streptomyces sp. BI20]|uniref:hypothetical protein n=1 Tax=Streptomyces sp. BI20 TaxID=3403460 RepID=UPI003C769B85